MQLNDAKEQITLQQLYAEIITLREQNAIVVAKFNELLVDKQCFLRRTDALQAELRSLQSKLCTEKLVSSINVLTSQINTLRTEVSTNNTNTPYICPVPTSLASTSFSTETIGSLTHASAVSVDTNTYAAAAVAIADTKDDVRAAYKKTINSLSISSPPISLAPTVSVPITEKNDSLTYAAVTSVNTNSSDAPAHIGLNNRLSSMTAAPTTTPRSLAQPQWEKVQSKRSKNKKAVRSIIIGQNDNKDLDVFASRRWLHLSSFKPTVTEENILSFVSKNAGIDKDNLSCFKLIKKGADTSLLRKVNFKLGITASLYDKVLNPALWPANVELRPFKFFQKEEAPKNQT